MTNAALRRPPRRAGARATSNRPATVRTVARLLPILLGPVLLAAGCASGPVPGASPGSPSTAVSPPPRYALVPMPAELEPRAGEFVFGPATRVMLPANATASLRESVDLVIQPLRRMSGFDLPVSTGGAAVSDALVIRIEGTTEGDADGRGRATTTTDAERYGLDIEPGRIVLAAPTEAGVFRGLMTLRQLLPPQYERGVRAEAPWGQVGGPAPAPGVVWSVPAARIADEPRFRWRGMHLDVGRHFYGVDFVKKYLDLLALHGMNTFHWHLTEDQGWRLPIQAYPRLTEVGGCRPETMIENHFDRFDGTEYCGSYTREEVVEVVEYAAARHITIVPEIEMPGHSLAALAAYPELGCTDGPFTVGTRWGVYPDIYCPKEETFAFLETVLTEAMEIFPGEFIHIGGDEAPKDRWEESEVAQEIIRREGLADEHELQSWFVRRIERFLNANGRRLIGWDEILEGGLAPNATVMSWRGEAGGIAAASDGHDVVMSPNSDLYFDHYQADPETSDEPLAICCLSTLADVYAYEPIPEELDAARAHHVLGAQANIWTEYIQTPDHVEYMALPRMAALAEAVWSPAALRDGPDAWADFLARLRVHLERLDEFGARYRPLDGN